jgi:DNA-binding phage protein
VASKKKKGGKRSVVLSRFDAADYLHSETEIAAFLKAARPEIPTDAAYLTAARRTAARARRRINR